jgi:hypothetical protein
MDGPIPIIIVTNPEGRRTRLRTDGPIPAIIVTNPEGIPTTIMTNPERRRTQTDSSETPKPSVYHRPRPSPMTPEEREIIFAGTQPVPPRSIFRKILMGLEDILCY